jgi:glucose-1-phosphate adenylyltransferase
MDYRKLIRFHRNSGAEVTIACSEHPASLAGSFGVLDVDSDNRITCFSEKPAQPRTLTSDPTKSLVSMGVYVFKKDVLWDALAGDGGDFGKHILPRFVAEGRAHGYNFTIAQPGFAYWRDVGTIDTYYQTQMEVLQISSLMSLDDPTHGWPIYSALHAPAPLPDSPDRAASIISPDAFVAPTAKVTRSIVMEGARIGSDSRVQRAIIMEGVSIPPKTEIGFDKQMDGSRFQITPKGVVIVDPDSARRLSNDSQRHLSLAYAG